MRAAARAASRKSSQRTFATEVKWLAQGAVSASSLSEVDDSAPIEGAWLHLLTIDNRRREWLSYQGAWTTTHRSYAGQRGASSPVAPVETMPYHRVTSE